MKTVETIKALALGVPARIVNYGFILGGRPVGGEHYLYSDDGMGMGRCWIAAFSAGKQLVGTLPDYMAAVDPASILNLIARLEAAEAGMEAAIAEAEMRGRLLGAQEARQKALDALWGVVSVEPDYATRKGAYAASQAVAAT